MTQFDWQGTYNRWRAQHRGKARVVNGVRPFKVKHWTQLGARWHRWSFCRRTGAPLTAFSVYPCRWHDDWREGETAWPHWHVGSTRYSP